MSAVTSFSKKASSSSVSLVSHSMPSGATVKNYSHHTVRKTTSEYKYSSHSDFLQFHENYSKLPSLCSERGFINPSCRLSNAGCFVTVNSGDRAQEVGDGT